MEFERVAEAVAGVPVMTAHQGRRVYDHILDTKPEHVLELGTARGVSAAYMAAALDELGRGDIVTVESSRFEWRDPSPAEVLSNAGLAHLVTLERSHSTYTWFLKERIEEQSDAAGNCEPIYDFCYLDGAHDWTVDGLAVYLVEKLLRPGGWLLLDDLDWTYNAAYRGQELPEGMSQAERTEPHVRAVFDLVVTQHPSFTELRIEDGSWGWARCNPGAPKTLQLTTTRSLGSYLVAAMRRGQRWAATRRA